MSNTLNDEVKLRRMTRTDIDEVLVLCKKVGGRQSHISYRDLVAMDPGGPLDMSLVAKQKGKITGFLLARLAYVYVPVTEICMIQSLVVDPEHQGKGLGTMLVNELLDNCHLNEIQTIRALVDEHDSDLRTFVENLGFRRSRILNYDKNINIE